MFINDFFFFLTETPFAIMTEHARLCYVLNEVPSWDPCALLWRRLGW